MERARATWTDERLDNLARHMDDGFNRVDDELRSLRTAMNARFDAMHARFDAFQRTMLQLGGAMIAAFLGLVATQL